MTFQTDNRWSPGASLRGLSDDEQMPTGCPAAYSARWIDMGNHALADILPDRQGFAYNKSDDRDRLIDLLMANDYRVRMIGGDEERDVTVTVDLPGWQEFHVTRRRSGGYVYVDAWLLPQHGINLDAFKSEVARG